MNVLGITAEYNPFHNGHLFHLTESKERTKADFVVAVMSGNFVQRGEPAMLDKWTRSRLAVECGIDLVLELPFAYACNSAEYFAKGALGIMNGLGCITHLSFGSETGALNDLEQLAQIQNNETFGYKDKMKFFLSQGLSYAKAKEEVLRQIAGESLVHLASSPNNILALEYLKQLSHLNSKIIPVAIKRQGTGYLSSVPSGDIASATAIRNDIDPKERGKFVPDPVKACLVRSCVSEQKLFDLTRSQILKTKPKRLAALFAAGEGLEYKLKKEVRKAQSFEMLVGLVKSKRYPETRIRRLLCHLLMDFDEMDEDYYGRVLAFNDKGAQLLRYLKHTAVCHIPIITNINKIDHWPRMLHFDVLASDVYHLLSGADLYNNSDFVKHPYSLNQRLAL